MILNNNSNDTLLYYTLLHYYNDDDCITYDMFCFMNKNKNLCFSV